MKVTNAPRPIDGFGAQYQGIICAITWAELNGHEFYYSTPDFSEVYSNTEAEDFETVMNIKANYPHAIGDEVVVSVQESYDFFENNIDFILNSDSFKKIKKIFFENKEKTFANGKHIAVHIRRPSIKATVDIPAHHHGMRVKHISDFSYDIGTRFTADLHFIKVISKLKVLYPEAQVHIFSEGTPDLFKSFESLGVKLHLDEPANISFTSIVLSDVLVTCKSSFSYVAALLTKGVVWHTPFWHRPASNWLKI
jgi:hypothetical protein